MVNPFSLPPHPVAQKAAAEVIEKVHAYLRMHPESELHLQGKMFGVLVYNDEMSRLRLNDATSLPNDVKYLAAFSAMLDGSYIHEGFVPPAFLMNNEQLTMNISPVGHSKEESQRLQRLLFAQYNLLNGKGEQKNLLEIFANEKAIVPPEEWFSDKLKIKNEELKMPPAGAGECCAPKLLQYAFLHGLKPLAMAEFWVGAPSKTEVRQEGAFYAPCSGKCVPILRHMLQGVEVEKTSEERHAEELCQQIEIVYEDEWLMVINKPSGLLSVPGKREEELSCESYLSRQRSAESGQPIFLKAVHRLDQDTSGLLVLAKTPEVYKTLQAYFQRRDILKRYEAVVRPNDEMSRLRLNDATSLPNDGIISLPLLPNPYDRPRQMVDKEHGKPAITKYVIRERRADGTILVNFFPQTGRTHQLRVHAAHPEGLNAPIVGDRLYGMIASLNDERMMLHAAEIQFEHPMTHETMHFRIPAWEVDKNN